MLSSKACVFPQSLHFNLDLTLSERLSEFIARLQVLQTHPR
jgi:hypothetical protein